MEGGWMGPRRAGPAFPTEGFKPGTPSGHFPHPVHNRAPRRTHRRGLTESRDRRDKAKTDGVTMASRRPQGILKKIPPRARPLPWKASFRQAWDLLLFSAALAVLFNLLFPYGIELKIPAPKGHGLMDSLKTHRDSGTASYAGFKPSPGRTRVAATPTPLPGAPEDVVRISLSGAKNRFDRNSSIFLDARPPEEYKGGHIPGALNFYADEFDQFAPQLLPLLPDKNKEIIAYGHGSGCELSILLARRLANLGYAHVKV